MSAQSTRRFPPPWTVEQIPVGYKVKDANGQSLAWVYGRESKADADIANVLTMDGARRIAANIAKLPGLLGAVPMGAAQRVSRGFHRLGLVLAALPLIATVLLMGITAITAYEDYRRHDELACAHDKVNDAFAPADEPWKKDPISSPINLHNIGCSDDPEKTVDGAEIYANPPFDWQTALVWPLVRIAAGGLAGALMLYGAVRAIGWVIGGFAAS
jgi:hypothetical protein